MIDWIISYWQTVFTWLQSPATNGAAILAAFYIGTRIDSRGFAMSKTVRDAELRLQGIASQLERDAQR